MGAAGAGAQPAGYRGVGWRTRAVCSVSPERGLQAQAGYRGLTPADPTDGVLAPPDRHPARSRAVGEPARPVNRPLPTGNPDPVIAAAKTSTALGAAPHQPERHRRPRARFGYQDIYVPADLRRIGCAHASRRLRITERSTVQQFRSLANCTRQRKSANRKTGEANNSIGKDFQTKVWRGIACGIACGLEIDGLRERERTLGCGATARRRVDEGASRSWPGIAGRPPRTGGGGTCPGVLSGQGPPPAYFRNTWYSSRTTDTGPSTAGSEHLRTSRFPRERRRLTMTNLPRLWVPRRDASGYASVRHDGTLFRVRKCMEHLATDKLSLYRQS